MCGLAAERVYDFCFKYADGGESRVMSGKPAATAIDSVAAMLRCHQRYLRVTPLEGDIQAVSFVQPAGDDVDFTMTDAIHLPVFLLRAPGYVFLLPLDRGLH